MSSKPFIMTSQLIVLIIILVFSSTTTFSTPLSEPDIGPLSEQDINSINEHDIGPLRELDIVSLNEQDMGPLSELDIASLNEQDMGPLSELDIASFFCPGRNRACCPLLAHRIASKHHSRRVTIVINNKSGHTIFFDGASLESGRWVTSGDDIDIGINCEPPINPLKDGKSEAFSAVTSHFLGGVKGFASFSMDDDTLS